ncbi:hypothetical protein RHECNPAF_430089 [Rhizobium etli CNPAF512]|nr:hypothetical protein RHECNPAF_430089 [Rhizobium etli CNPAF512]
MSTHSTAATSHTCFPDVDAAAACSPPEALDSVPCPGESGVTDRDAPDKRRQMFRHRQINLTIDCIYS